MKRTKIKKFNVKKAKRELDTLFSRAIRSRDKVCQKCLSSPASQAAHIFTRGNLTTRWDKDNALGLCYPCHIHWAHRKPVEFTLWIIERMGEENFATLRKKAKTIYDSSNFKADFARIKAELSR